MDSICKEKLEFANKLIFVRRYTEAEKALNECLLLPGCAKEPLIHLRRIELMSLLGRVDELRTLYSRSSTDSKDPSNRLFGLLTELFLVPNQEELEGSDQDSLPSMETSTGSADQPPRAVDVELRTLISTSAPSSTVLFALGYAAEQQGLLEVAKRHYEESLSADPTWYPSAFGLSQVYYNLGDERQGDQYFQQFEMLAPFNVYGNFETHRKLSQEFLQQGRHEDAERAIQMLTTWWVDNKGFAPAEIQAFEQLAIARISVAKKDFAEAQVRRTRGVQLAEDLINSAAVDENILYFMASVLEDFGEQQLSFQAYKKVLQVAGSSASVVQKVGSHFLGHGQFDAALELFEHAYRMHPDNPEIRFCLLVARLKKAGVPVEEYLIGRERIRQLADNGDRVELLGLLNALMQKFTRDWDVHFHLAELFVRLGHPIKASQHYAKMYELDPLGQHSRLRYANFLMNQGQSDQAMEILNLIQVSSDSLNEIQAEVQWLKAAYYDRKEQWETCGEIMKPLLEKDPWNITYLIQEIVNLTGVKEGKEAVQSARTNWVQKLAGGEESKVSWAEFARDTAKLSSDHLHDLAYARRKLQFLYMRGSDVALKAVVSSACLYDASKGAKDLLRLLNTNFDSPTVYWGLGLLYKELWLLEVASTWFEHTLSMPGVDDRIKSQIYADLADTYVWRNIELGKAVEFCRLALDLGERKTSVDARVMTVMAHALLKQGQPRQASSFLEQLQQQDSVSYEVRYLLGLVYYRNGHPKDANEIWKPLLKHRPEQMRENKIKQEVMRYYFEAAPYFPRDLSKAN